MQLVLMSGNAGKLKEIQAIFSDLGIPVRAYTEVLDTLPEFEETGKTFAENAIIKVDSCPELPDTIFLADDSGLEVDALNGAPGIYSARYAGPNASKTQLCEKVLSEMSGKTNRKANFNSTIAIRFPNGQIELAEGKVFGRITLDMAGDGGFGYDPIFIPEGYDVTFSEMPQEEKNKISHRFKALIEAKTILQQAKVLND